MLTVQLAKPTLDLANLKLVPNPDSQRILSTVLPLLLQSSLQGLGQPGVMEAVGNSLRLSDVTYSCQCISESWCCTGILWLYGCCKYSRWINCGLLMISIKLARDFVDAFYQLPIDAFNGLMQCAITSLAMQERYSLVSACTFLVYISTCLPRRQCAYLSNSKFFIGHPGPSNLRRWGPCWSQDSYIGNALETSDAGNTLWIRRHGATICRS